MINPMSIVNKCLGRGLAMPRISRDMRSRNMAYEDFTKLDDGSYVEMRRNTKYFSGPKYHPIGAGYNPDGIEINANYGEDQSIRYMPEQIIHEVIEVPTSEIEYQRRKNSRGYKIGKDNQGIIFYLHQKYPEYKIIRLGGQKLISEHDGVRVYDVIAIIKKRERNMNLENLKKKRMIHNL